MTGTPAPITGSDGIQPIENPDGLWHNWALQELYVGGAGSGKYVGKVNDYVTDYTTDERWKIVDLDQSTLVPTLKAIAATKSDESDFTDVLTGSAIGVPADTFRILIDKTKRPYACTLDQRCFFPSVLTKYVKVFRGSKVSGDSTVISAYYDSQGNLLGENVPLQLAAIHNGTNYSIKNVPTFYTTAEIDDGDQLTVVAYADDGGAVSLRTVMALESSTIRSTDAAAKYITGITLDSPFLSSADPNTLIYPMNVTLDSLNLFGVVHYSDNTKLRMPVDGSKFSILGFKPYVATVVGQKVKLTLKYALSSDEYVYVAQNAPGSTDRFITETYTAQTQNVDGAYSLKLFVAPQWNSTVNQWRLQWLLYNLDRTVCIDVTPYVKYKVNTPAFDPTAFGVNQQLEVQVNMNDVNGMYNKFIFNQVLSVVLYRNGTDHSGTPFTVYYDPSQNPPYGVGLVAKSTFVNQNLKRVDVSQGKTDLPTFLATVLDPAKPLYDTRSEPTYPAPTHFSFLWSDGTESVFTIDQYSAQNVVSQTVTDGTTLLVKFFKRTPENDLQIAVCPMVIQQTN